MQRHLAAEQRQLALQLQARGLSLREIGPQAALASGRRAGGAVYLAAAGPLRWWVWVPGLRRPKLAAMRPLAPELLITARTQRWAPEELLRTLVEAETTAREVSNARTRLKAAVFPLTKTLEEFDRGAYLHPPRPRWTTSPRWNGSVPARTSAWEARRGWQEPPARRPPRRRRSGTARAGRGSGRLRPRARLKLLLAWEMHHEPRAEVVQSRVDLACQWARTCGPHADWVTQRTRAFCTTGRSMERPGT